eukprot:CAMPEP_0181397258 /NCGR_PEP_ID=MMETSP1110-20121109/377_1 /TAXON_ID=174948 /ORGANISM="Symbiodinium sp., Strain CCMP421" /LENGTH=97 /DNA_ID=CAMNT_0023519061 /DNA_START=536 /DNA_END=825 /DNA_ORIENTATION=-
MARQSRTRSTAVILALACVLLWNAGSPQGFASPSVSVQHQSSTALTQSSSRTGMIGTLREQSRDSSAVATAAAAAAPNFFSKVFAAGAQGATAAFVA